MPESTFDNLLSAARRLSPAEQLHLANALLRELARVVGLAPVKREMRVAEALAALEEVRAHFTAQGPVSPNIADDIAASRR